MAPDRQCDSAWNVTTKWFYMAGQFEISIKLVSKRHDFGNIKVSEKTGRAIADPAFSIQHEALLKSPCTRRFFCNEVFFPSLAPQIRNRFFNFYSRFI
jgi:hypothetical protein